jgi:hypothetical protein
MFVESVVVCNFLCKVGILIRGGKHLQLGLTLHIRASITGHSCEHKLPRDKSAKVSTLYNNCLTLSLFLQTFSMFVSFLKGRVTNINFREKILKRRSYFRSLFFCSLFERVFPTLKLSNKSAV